MGSGVSAKKQVLVREHRVGRMRRLRRLRPLVSLVPGSRRFGVLRPFVLEVKELQVTNLGGVR